MDSAVVEVPATPASKTPNTLKLTREGLYMLEACLRQMAGVNDFQKAVLWDKVQRKARKANDRRVKISWDPEGHDLEKQFFRKDGETDLEFARRSNEYRESHKAWQSEPVEFALSNKHFNAAKEAVKFVFENGYKDQTKCQVQLPLNEHTTGLLIELKLADAEGDDE